MSGVGGVGGTDDAGGDGVNARTDTGDCPSLRGGDVPHAASMKRRMRAATGKLVALFDKINSKGKQDVVAIS